MRYANPWSGSGQFYKGKTKKLPTTDKDYRAYCKRKKNKNKILSYEEWSRKERIRSGMF